MRETIAFGILVLVMIFLFAFVFAVLGKGEYEPSHEGGSAELQATIDPAASAS